MISPRQEFLMLGSGVRPVCVFACVCVEGVKLLKIIYKYVYLFFTGILYSFHQILELIPDPQILKTTTLECLLA